MPSKIILSDVQVNVPGQQVSGSYGTIIYTSTINELVQLLNSMKISPSKIIKIAYDTSEAQYFAVYHT